MDFYSGKKVLITGITGFIGSKIAEKLVKKGAKVFGYARFSALPNMQNLEEIKDKVELIRGDLTDYNSIIKMMERVKPDIIFHMGAVTHVHYSFDNPIETIRTNMEGIVNLLEACRTFPVKRFIYPGTSEEYGNIDESLLPIKEETVLRPESPYSITKVGCEHFCRVYYESYNIPCIMVRNFNTFGRKVDNNFFIEKTVSQALTQDIIKLGTDKSTRDFNYVDNAADAFIFLAEKEEAVGQVFNVCRGEEFHLKDVAEKIVSLVGRDVKIVWNSFPPRPNELWRLLGDNSKLKSLGFVPSISFDEGLKRTIEIWKKNLCKQ